MLGSPNYDTKELCATDQDLRTYIDSVNKERAAYLEQNTLRLKNVADIIFNNDSIKPQNRQNRRDEDRHKNRHIPLEKNEQNKSKTASETIDPNTNKIIEPNTNKIIEPNGSNKI